MATSSYALKFLVYFIIFFLQATLLQIFTIKSAKLDIILIFIIYSGLRYGVKSGIITGFIFGLLGDIMSVSLIGINTFSKTFIGLLAGLIKVFYKNNRFNNILIIAVFTIFDAFLFIVLTNLFQKNMNTYGFILHSFPISVLFNAVSGMIIFSVFDAIDNIVKEYNAYKGIRYGK